MLKIFDQLQNIIMKKILKIFKTTLIEIMKTEYNLILTKLRLLKKFQKYVIRIAKTEHVNNFIEYISHKFFKNLVHRGFN